MKIIVLDSTAKSIKAVLASSVATSNPDFVVAYADTSDNTFSELSSDGQLNGTTDVTLVSAPASGVKRAIKSITIYNRDTAAVTVSIKFDNGGTQRILQRVQLVSGETWHSDELTKLSPGGSDTQVQFNDLGTLAGSSNFTYNKTTSVLTLGANPVLTAGTANGVLYLNGSKVATSGSALTFDGTNFVLGAGGASGSFPFTQRVSASASPVSAFRITNGSDATFDVTLQTSLASFGTGIGDLAFLRQGSEQMRLTSTGLGIGTSSPAQKLDVIGNAQIGNASTSAAVTRMYNQNSNLYVGVDSSTGGNTGTAYAQYFLGVGAYPMTFWTNTTERMRLDSSGNLGLGVTPSAWGAGGNIDLSNAGSLVTQGPLANMGSNWYYSAGYKYKTASFAAQYAQNYGAHIWYTAPSGTANTAITFTQAMTLDASGNLGVGTPSPNFFGSGTKGITVNGSSGSHLEMLSNGASLGFLLANNNGLQIQTNSNNPLIFNTNNTERARITSGGYLGISTSSPQNYIDLGQPSNGQGLTWSNYSNIFSEYSSGALILSSNYYGNIGSGGYKTAATATFGAAGIQVSGTSGSGTSGLIQFFVDPATSKTAGNAFTPTERARITSGGDLLVGTTSTLSAAKVTIKTPDGSGSQIPLCLAVGLVSDGFGGVSFRNPNGPQGSIAINSATVSYNTTSDYRLKDNPQPLTGSGTFIDALKPKTWNWKANGSRGVGFIAHEVQEVSPGSVVGEKDGEQMQAMEYGSAEFIANIIAELQSLRQRVALLEGTQP